MLDYYNAVSQTPRCLQIIHEMQYVPVYIAKFAAVQLYVCMHEPPVQLFECRLSCQPCIGAVLMLPEHVDS